MNVALERDHLIVITGHRLFRVSLARPDLFWRDGLNCTFWLKLSEVEVNLSTFLEFKFSLLSRQSQPVQVVMTFTAASTHNAA